MAETNIDKISIVSEVNSGVSLIYHSLCGGSAVDPEDDGRVPPQTDHSTVKLEWEDRVMVELHHCNKNTLQLMNRVYHSNTITVSSMCVA